MVALLAPSNENGIPSSGTPRLDRAFIPSVDHVDVDDVNDVETLLDHSSARSA